MPPPHHRTAQMSPQSGANATSASDSSRNGTAPKLPPTKRRRMVKSDPVEIVDVIGDPARTGDPLGLDAVMGRLDLVAGRCAYAHSRASVVTGCIDELVMHSWLCHGDLIALRASVSAVGTSSMLIEVEVVRLPSRLPQLVDNPEPEQLVFVCFTTFVTRDSREPVDKVDTTPETQARFSQFKRNRKALQERNLTALSKDAHSGALYTAVAAAEHEQTLPDASLTALRLRVGFLPRSLNYGGVVFGGDLLEQLDRAAVACAARVVGAPCGTVGLRAVAFLAAITGRVMVEIDARVVACDRRVAIVVLRTRSRDARLGKDATETHCGIFFVARRGAARTSLQQLRVGVRVPTYPPPPTMEEMRGAKGTDGTAAAAGDGAGSGEVAAAGSGEAADEEATTDRREFWRAAAVDLPAGRFERWLMEKEQG